MFGGLLSTLKGIKGTFYYSVLVCALLALDVSFPRIIAECVNDVQCGRLASRLKSDLGAWCDFPFVCLTVTLAPSKEVGSGVKNDCCYLIFESDNTHGQRLTFLL